MQRHSDAKIDTEIVSLTAPEVEPVQDQLVQIYGQTFTQPPYSETDSSVRGFAQSLPRYIRRRDFRCCVARNLQQDRFVGFAIGYRCSGGQWWYDIIARTLASQLIDEWFTGAFELVDLAVLPDFRGRGIGGRLHDTILAELPHQTAVLSTLQQETAAMHLYRNRGWRILAEDFHFPGVDHTYWLMGLSLQNSGQHNAD